MRVTKAANAIRRTGWLLLTMAGALFLLGVALNIWEDQELPDGESDLIVSEYLWTVIWALGLFHLSIVAFAAASLITFGKAT